MLVNELVEAWSEVAKEKNGESASIAGLTDAQRRWLAVPSILQPHEIQFLMRLYARDDFDRMLVGSGRHKVFAKWAIDNRDEWKRVMEREEHQLIIRCETAADTFPIKLPATGGGR